MTLSKKEIRLLLDCIDMRTAGFVDEYADDEDRVYKRVAKNLRALEERLRKELGG